MLKRLMVLMLALLALSSMTLLVSAQETIAYGDIITGEITNDEFEIEYAFEAAAGDLVVVEMRRADTDSELYNADLIVLNPAGDMIADTTDYYGSNGAQAVVLFEAAEDGTYTILATRDGGRGGSEVGNFTLRLIQAEELTSTPIQGEMGTEALDAYYAIRTDGPVNVRYTWLEGNYAPAMQVRLLEEMGYPSNQSASVSGTLAEDATVTVVVQGENLLLVSVTGNPIDYFFNDVSASFELSLAD
jgi:hypothetical protein